MFTDPLTPEEQTKLRNMLGHYSPLQQGRFEQSWWAFDELAKLGTRHILNKNQFPYLRKLTDFADRIESVLQPGNMQHECPGLFHPREIRRALVMCAFAGQLGPIVRYEGPAPRFTLKQLEGELHNLLGERALFGASRHQIREQQLFDGDRIDPDFNRANQMLYDDFRVTEPMLRGLHQAYLQASDTGMKVGYLLGVWGLVATDAEIAERIPPELAEKAYQEQLGFAPSLLRKFALNRAELLLDKAENYDPSKMRKPTAEKTALAESLKTKLPPLYRKLEKSLQPRREWPNLGEAITEDPMAGSEFPALDEPLGPHVAELLEQRTKTPNRSR